MTRTIYAALPFLMLAAAVVLIVVALVTSQLYWLAGAGLLVLATVLHALNERRDRDG